MFAGLSRVPGVSAMASQEMPALRVRALQPELPAFAGARLLRAQLRPPTKPLSVEPGARFGTRS